MIVSWIKSKALVLVGSVALCAIVWGGLASSLYVGSQKELSSLKEKHTQLEDEYQSLSKQVDELLAEDKKKSTVVVDLIESLSVLEEQKDQALTKLSSFRCVKPKTTSAQETQNEEVDVNKPFSIEFRNALRLSAPSP